MCLFSSLCGATQVQPSIKCSSMPFAITHLHCLASAIASVPSDLLFLVATPLLWWCLFWNCLTGRNFWLCRPVRWPVIIICLRLPKALFLSRMTTNGGGSYVHICDGVAIMGVAVIPHHQFEQRPWANGIRIPFGDWQPAFLRWELANGDPSSSEGNKPFAR